MLRCHIPFEIMSKENQVFPFIFIVADMICMVLRVEITLRYELFIGILIDVMNKIGFGTEVALAIVRIKEAHVVCQGAGTKQSADFHIIQRHPRRWLAYSIIIAWNYAGSWNCFMMIITCCFR